MVKIGDTVTVYKGDTTITGKVAGLVMDNKGSQIARVYIQELTDYSFWMSLGWSVIENKDKVIELVGRND